MYVYLVKMDSSDSDSEIINFCEASFDGESETENEDDKDKNAQKLNEYELLSRNEIICNMMEEIHGIVNILMVAEPIARCLLNHYKWKKDQLLDDYYNSPDLDVFFQSVGIENPTLCNNSESSQPDADCGICFTSFSEIKSKNLVCGHQYCSNCWCQYLKTKVLVDGEGNIIKCPDPDCKTLIDYQTIMDFVPDATIKQQLQMLITNTFVSCNPMWRWCQTPDCDYVIKVQKMDSLPVLCNCGFESCLQCGELWHDSVTCALLERWIKCSKDDPETEMWIQQNAKKCPKCTINIEKNGGCNHMTCKSCRKEFCWLCMQTWNSSHRCNQFESQMMENMSLRFLHYNTRYRNHIRSLKLERGLYNSIESKMKNLQGMASLTRNEVLFLKRAVDSLRRSRQILISTYVFAYYSEKSNQLLMFEDNQRDLELATESLSWFLEQDITNESMVQIKQRVQEKYNYCDQRRTILLDHIHEGYENGYWNL